MLTLRGYDATFYCCRGNPACQGMRCADNNGLVGAWPRLDAGSAKFDTISGCVPAFPWLRCGRFVTVKNVDRRTALYGKSIRVKIVDALFPSACPSETGLPRPLGIDLGVRAMVELAGDLSWGNVQGEITY